jgi:hypothetical protein
MPNTVAVVFTNQSGFESVSPDPLAIITDPEGGSQPEPGIIYLPTIYAGTTYSIDIQFTVTYYDTLNALIGTSLASNVTTTFNFAQFGMSAVKLNASTYRISGTYSNAFPDEYYRFKLKNNTTAVLPANTTEDFLALVEYNMPQPVTTNKEMLFNVSAPATFNGSPNINWPFTMYQWVVWRYQSAVASVQSLVNQGI